jgi:hypothetical protein
MILLLFVISLILLLWFYKEKEKETEPFLNKNTILDTFMNASPMGIVDGIHKRIHPYIPYKRHYYKWKRYLRYR